MSVFSISIVDFEQVKSRLGSNSHRSKNRDIALLLFVKNVWFIVEANWDPLAILNESFSKISLLLKVVNSFNKIYLGSITGCWIYLGYFFRFTFNIDLFVSPEIYTRSIGCTECTGCGTCPNLTTGIPKQCLSFRFEVFVNFWQVFSLFLAAFIVDFEYSLFIVNFIKCYLVAYLCEIPSRRNIYGICCETLVRNCANILHRYLSISFFDDVIFYFFTVLIGKTWSMSLMKFNNRIFYILFYFIPKFSHCFKVLMFTIETAF